MIAVLQGFEETQLLLDGMREFAAFCQFFGGRVENHVVGSDREFDVRQCHQAGELGGDRERGLRDSASTHDDNFFDATLPQSGECVSGDVGTGQLLGIGRQNASDVERDISVSDDDRAAM